MPIYLGSDQVSGIWLGTKEVTRIWKGTDLVYQRGTPGPAENVLFDHGWVTDIPWSGNLLTRPPYTTLVTYTFSNVEAYGFMRLMQETGPSYSAVSHNGHVCTTNLITVPANATKLRITCKRAAESPLSFNWGLLSANAANSMDSTGGQLSSTTTWLATDQVTTLDLTLNSGIAGGQYRVIVNSVNSNANSYYTHYYPLDIYKVWFE